MAGVEGEDGSGDELSPGEAALREALAEHGEEIGAALEHADEAKEALDTVVLTVASADEDEVEYVTEAIVNLVDAVDGLSTAESAALAETVGENGEDLASALETVIRLERDGSLDDLAALAGTLSALEVDEDGVRGATRLLGAIGEAERGSEPVSALGLLRGLRTPDARAGVGYLFSVLRAVGRGFRGG